MPKQIAAANWKMNLTFKEAQNLLNEFKIRDFNLSENQLVILAVPFPYLNLATEILGNKTQFFISAQDVSAHDKGAYTGEVSAAMLQSLSIKYVLVGHSERREYHNENALLLLQKLKQALANNLQPIFCCGEPLAIREAGKQNEYVTQQLKEVLFEINKEEIKNIIIAYEPIWAIGTGKTASSEQAREIHEQIRGVLISMYGEHVANDISILYGGSVKGSNAAELFAKQDVDGGLVGGASLDAEDFSKIINSLQA